MGLVLHLTPLPVYGSDQMSTLMRNPDCRSIVIDAARQRNIPPLIILAVGYTEAGYRARIWPWTLNLAGQSRYFSSHQTALSQLKAVLGSGDQNVDAGCMQLNAKWVGKGMSAEELLDPETNVMRAASHLKELYRETGSWARAIAYYHSRDSERGLKYACRVYAWLSYLKTGEARNLHNRPCPNSMATALKRN